MMIHVYDKSYISDVMVNLGTMMDYGTHTLGLSVEDMYHRFISSGIAGCIESGHPRYLAGLSGIELAVMASGKEFIDKYNVCPGAVYWAGWALGYLQWETGMSFEELELCGMGIMTVVDMFNPYHEADITKFAEDAKRIIKSHKSGLSNPLKRYRKASGLSQEELSERSGVSVRAIRSYEQNTRTLSRAEAGTIACLAGALGCRIEKLL